MLETLLITFREGLEAFLIIAIMVAYLKKTRRHNLLKVVYGSVIVALLISVTTAWHIAELAQDPIWEGSLAIIAGVLVASFTLYVMRKAQHFRQEIDDKLEKKAQKSGLMAEISVFIFTVLMVAREGMETALMLGAISAKNDPLMMSIGAIGGLAAVGVVGALWLSQSHRVNLRLFMQATGAFLLLFSIYLFIFGLHELSEMQAIPFLSESMNVTFHMWTEPIESGIVSVLITLGLFAVPFGWLGGSFIKDKFFTPRMIAAE